MDVMHETNEIPLFPLAEVMLFPDLRMPLHVFEARYRQLANDALAGQKLIGMATVLPSERKNIDDQPQLFPVGCAGKIIESRQLDDGRYLLVLFGTKRFQILGEKPPSGQRLYRVAKVEWLDEEDEPAEQNRISAMRSRLKELSADYLESLPADAAGNLRQVLDATLPDRIFVQLLALTLPLDPSERMSLLESSQLSERYFRLIQILQFQSLLKQSNSSQLH